MLVTIVGGDYTKTAAVRGTSRNLSGFGVVVTVDNKEFKTDPISASYTYTHGWIINENSMGQLRAVCTAADVNLATLHNNVLASIAAQLKDKKPRVVEQ